MKMHESITEERVVELVKQQMFGLENPGICLACGAEADSCEPDAREYLCEECNERQVYGAQEILFMFAT